jgi:hypothetical protein
MAQTISGKTAMHPHLKMTWKRAMKIEKVARLSLHPAGYSNEQIANFLGCDKQTVVLIRQIPQYHAKMIELQSGLTSSWDQELRTDSDNARAELKSMLPGSMMVIRDAIQGKFGAALQFKAAQEVMDREGTLAKVSKSSVSVETKPNMVSDPNVVSNLMALLSGAPSVSDKMSADFTISAQDAGIQQQGMSEDNTQDTLNKLDLSNQKPN